jgi:hypothetical protein
MMDRSPSQIPVGGFSLSGPQPHIRPVREAGHRSDLRKDGLQLLT